jgi:hypothetical protein
MLMRSLRAAFAWLFGPPQTSDEGPKTGTLSVAPTIQPDDAASHALVGRPVLVSLLLDGRLVQQREMAIDRCGHWVFLFRDLPLGTYSVKFEAPGVETVIKRGLAVTATNEPVVMGDLRAGQGTRLVEYGKAGTELLGRVKELEAVVESLKVAG